MVLLIRENCVNCPQEMLDKIKNLGGKIFTVIQHPDGMPYVQLELQKFSSLSKDITGLPALFTEGHIYMGLDPILDFINSYKETVHAR